MALAITIIYGIALQMNWDKPMWASPEDYQYDINVAEVAEVWHRGSVIASKLLSAMRYQFGGHFEKSGKES